MATNTFNGMTFTNILNKGISALEQALIPMQGFTMDMSAGLAKYLF